MKRNAIVILIATIAFIFTACEKGGMSEDETKLIEGGRYRIAAMSGFNLSAREVGVGENVDADTVVEMSESYEGRIQPVPDYERPQHGDDDPVEETVGGTVAPDEGDDPVAAQRKGKQVNAQDDVMDSWDAVPSSESADEGSLPAAESEELMTVTASSPYITFLPSGFFVDEGGDVITRGGWRILEPGQIEFDKDGDVAVMGYTVSDGAISFTLISLDEGEGSSIEVGNPAATEEPSTIDSSSQSMPDGVAPHFD